MAINYGSDTSTWGPDGRPSMGFDRPDITGIRVVLEAAARTITTPLGELFFDTTIGVTRPLQSLVNADLSDADLVNIAGEWAQAVREQVDFVTRARFVITRDATGKNLSFVATIWTADGAFPLLGSAGDALKVLFPSGT